MASNRVCSVCSHSPTEDSFLICKCEHCELLYCFKCYTQHHKQIIPEKKLNHRIDQFKILLEDKKKTMQQNLKNSKDAIQKWYDQCLINLRTILAPHEQELNEQQEKIQNSLTKMETDFNDCFGSACRADVQNSNSKNPEILESLEQQLNSLKINFEVDLPPTDLRIIYPTDEQAKDNWEQELSASEHDQDSSETDDDTDSDEDSFVNSERFIRSSYAIERMASDGLNLLYAGVDDAQNEIIGYLFLDPNDPKYGQEDPIRQWHQSSIENMIWWEKIEKFVCLTENGTYTVEYQNKLKILLAMNDRWNDPQIAVNNQYLGIWSNRKISLFNKQFQLVRTMSPTVPQSLVPMSFCFTNDLIAFAMERSIKNGKTTLEVHIYTFGMVRKKCIRFGIFDDEAQIKSSEKNRFFLSIGQQRFYIVSEDGTRETVNLGKVASTIDVINDRTVVLTNNRTDVELVRL